MKGSVALGKLYQAARKSDRPMSVFIPTLKALMMSYRQGIADGSQYKGIRAIIAAIQIIMFPNLLVKFHSLAIVEKLQSKTRPQDPLYFLTHTYYLSKRLTLRQKFQVAVDHHEYESKYYISEYIARVYHSEGVKLWERFADNHHFAIELIVTEDNLHEGELSVILSIDNNRLCRMSFCYVSAGILWQTPYMTLLITRNQTDNTPYRTMFDTNFKQNSPQIFCLAALCGIAIAN